MAPRQEQSDENDDAGNAANSTDDAADAQEEDNEMSLDELLYSTTSFHAIIKPGM